MLSAKLIRVLMLLIVSLATSSLATSAPRAAERDPMQPITVLDTVVVSGEQPGPGLWKVSKGDHALWILGTLSPLPKRMRWSSREVEARVALSQAVLMPPSISMKVDGGLIRGIFLLPSLMKARNNPDKEKLVDVLPPDLYARWSALKQRYVGRDRGIEKRRPIIAAQKLQDEALDRVGLSGANVIEKVVRRAAKRHDVAMTSPRVEITISDPKQAIREFSDASLDDVECFRKTIERLESEIETMKLRANAWALGEIEILRKLPHTDNFRACADALLETKMAKRHGFDDLEARVATAWLSAAESALDKHHTSFAMLPMGLMLREDGYLAKLAARGYQVEAPKPQ